MRRKDLVLAASLLAAAVLFILGVGVGRWSVQLSTKSRQVFPDEAPLVGEWKMVPNDGASWKVAFLANRTAIRFDTDGEQQIIATWGRVRDELSIQNQHHPQESQSYMPPTISRVVDTGDDAFTLHTLDGTAEWRLVRL